MTDIENKLFISSVCRGEDEEGLIERFGLIYMGYALLCEVVQSHLTPCDPLHCSPLGSFVHGDSPGKNTGVDCHALLQRIFPIQGSNPFSFIADGFFTIWATREAHTWTTMYNIYNITSRTLQYSIGNFIQYSLMASMGK